MKLNPKLLATEKTYFGYELWFPLTTEDISSAHVKMTTSHFWCYYKQSQNLFLKQGTVMQYTKTISAKVFPKGLAMGWEVKRMNIMNVPSITELWKDKELSFQGLQTGWKFNSLSSMLTSSAEVQLSSAVTQVWKWTKSTKYFSCFRVFCNC